jgi:hypothetical protein
VDYKILVGKSRFTTLQCKVLKGPERYFNREDFAFETEAHGKDGWALKPCEAFYILLIRIDGEYENINKYKAHVYFTEPLLDFIRNNRFKYREIENYRNGNKGTGKNILVPYEDIKQFLVMKTEG